jgi:multiple sugar transport system substrate-binding protein
VFDNNGTWETDLYSDDYKRALQFFADLALTEGVVPPGATETGYPEAAAFFAQEKTGLMITGSNAIGAIESDNPALKGKIGSAIIPMDQRHVTVLQPSGYAITTSSKHPEIVADYLKFMNSDETAVNFGINSGRLPVVQTAAANEAFSTDTYKGFIESFEYAIKTPAFPEHTEIFDIMAESYSLMIGNNASVDEAMEQVKARMEPLLAQNNQ